MSKGIYIPGIGRTVSVTAYVHAIKTAKANPNETFAHGFNSPDRTTGAQVVNEWRRVINDRINRMCPLSMNPPAGDYRDRREGWRKFHHDYQVRLMRDAMRLRDIAHRVCVYQFETTEVRERFADRLSRHDD